MLDDSTFQHCLDAAYRFLDYRPRSEAELRQRLHQRGFDSEAIEKTIASLKDRHIIDDLAFAQYWKDNRLSHKPKSKRLIQKELREKKVAPEILTEVTEDIDDEASAYELGCAKMHILAHQDYPDFHRRLGNYLAYRGFSYEIIRHTIAQLWQEREQF